MNKMISADITSASEASSKDAATNFQRIFELAQSVMGGSEQALRWMGTPVRALDYLTPVSLLGSKDGIEAVETILARLEHGIPS
jgi:putative toxin-antitoxin system antitoxin component (TIGR02293 family)